MKLKMTCDFLRGAIVQICGEPPAEVQLTVGTDDDDETHYVEVTGTHADAIERYRAKVVKAVQP